MRGIYSIVRMNMTKAELKAENKRLAKENILKEMFAGAREKMLTVIGIATVITILAFIV